MHRSRLLMRGEGFILAALLCALTLVSCQGDVIEFVDRGIGYELSIATDGGNGTGTVSYTAAHKALSWGTVATLSPTPGWSSHFKGWSGANGGEVYRDGSAWKLLMDGDKELTAAFTKMIFGGGEYSSLIAEVGGSVWTFGYNDNGQLGDGTITQNGKPTKVASLPNVIAIYSNSHILAVTEPGAVYAWGYNLNGQVGNTGAAANQTTPIQVQGVGGAGYLTDVVAVGGGPYHSLAVKAGTVFAWGSNSLGQLGNTGAAASQTTPIQVQGVGGAGYLTNVVAIASRNYHNLALKADGTVYAWGSNMYGQLGNGTTTNAATPIQVRGVGGSGYLTDIVAVAGGWTHNLALATDGSVYAWGVNTRGQLGDGTTTSRTTPVRVAGPGGSGYLTDIVGIGAGHYHNFALGADGTVYAWGQNNFGQLGDGTTTNRTAPVEVDIDF